MPQQTKIFRVFVSSTFSDMRLERKLLREKVFPELENFCRANGARFQAIDLRWGVSEESQRDQKTMEICLNEIRRCQQLSPRPNFLILLGNRYGWQPVPTAIPQTEMDAIKQRFNPDECKLVQDWYMLDENAVPAEYVLQPWGERINEYEAWEPIENRLRMVLRGAALKAKLSKDALVKYTTSATHQEILAGALNPAPDVVDPESHVLAFSRTISNLPQDDSAKDYIDLIQDKPDQYSRDMLINLRGDLKSRLKDNFVEYDASLGDEGITFENGQTFIDRTINHLKSVIESEQAKVVDEDEIKQEMRYHEEFAKTLTAHFTGREDSLERIRDYLDDTNNGQVLSLIGASGSGKTSVMAKALLEARRRNAVLVYRFIGANAKSSNLISLLSIISGQIAQAYDTTLENLAEESQKGQLFNINTLTELFYKCLALAKLDKPLILFLDGLDQLSDTDNARSLNWLPRELTPHARIIISCLPEFEGILNNTDVYHLPLMPKADGERLLDTWLDVSRKNLTDAQKKEVLDQFNRNGLPLYLKIAFEQARKWRSYSGPEKLADDVPALIEQFLSVIEQEHSQALVSKAVSYILSGKDKGLTEDEILDMLVLDEEYWQYFLKHSHPAHRKEVEKAKSLPVVVWSRLFLDLAPYLTERDSYGERIIGFYHKQFDEVLRKKYVEDEKTVHRQLAEYFRDQADPGKDQSWEGESQRVFLELPFHLARSNVEELVTILFNFNWIQKKTDKDLAYDLLLDYAEALHALAANHPRRRALELIQCGLRLSSHIISKDKNQLASQLTGRLLGLEKLEITALLGVIRNAQRDPWLRPLKPALNQASEVLLLKLEDLGSVLAIAVTSDGGRAVIGSDLSLQVWDLETGKLLQTLEGHTDLVNAVVITSNGCRAVSG